MSSLVPIQSDEGFISNTGNIVTSNGNILAPNIFTSKLGALAGTELVVENSIGKTINIRSNVGGSFVGIFANALVPTLDIYSNGSVNIYANNDTGVTKKQWQFDATGNVTGPSSNLTVVGNVIASGNIVTKSLIIGNITVAGNTISSNILNGNVTIAANGAFSTGTGNVVIQTSAGNFIFEANGLTKGASWNQITMPSNTWLYAQNEVGIWSQDSVGKAGIFQIRPDEVAFYSEIITFKSVFNTGEKVLTFDTSKLNVEGNVLPSTTNSFDLGTSSIKWNNAWVSGNVNSGNIIASANVNAGNIIASANVNAGNVIVIGSITSNSLTTGNVSAGNVIVTTGLTLNGTPIVASNAANLNSIDTMTTTGNVSVGGNLTATGGIRKSARVLTTTTTLTVADASGFIELTPGGGPYTITLPNPTLAANSGIGYRFWQNTTDNITLSTPAGAFYGPSGSSTSTKVLAQATTQYWDVWSDGFNWSVFGIKIA